MEKEKGRKLELLADRLQRDIDTMQEEHKVELSHLEAKVDHLNRSLTLDASRFGKQETNRNAAINELTRKLQDAYAELELKGGVVSSLSEETQIQREQINELRARDTEHERQSEKYVRKILEKEKEIEKLHKLLSTSYGSVNPSLNGIASRLEKRTQELAKKVQEASTIVNIHKEKHSEIN
eukprot:TRINITY_DN22660_c0_g1_i2.p1 TRINITY_DN22660_c0_g1~~TRINITY_DN22660_c0_g1_i2.p1  ORF type:complete len:181 (+),score=47.45 TRINITY_DN22660_c0_g1_i2:236-778(+)